jgi:hypothetical protein
MAATAAPEVFVASRFTAGNLLFPTALVVTDQVVMRRKRSWLTLNEESVHVRNVATVNITTGILWSTIRIESSGGSDPLESRGHTKGDARRIKELIEERQAGLARAEAQAAGHDTKPCPWCAETIKKAAKICRFCNREVA